MQSCDNIEGALIVVQPRFRRASALCHNRCGIMNISQPTRDQVAVETMGFSGRIGTEESQNGSEDKNDSIRQRRTGSFTKTI